MTAFIDKDGAPVEVFPGIAFVDRDEIRRPSNWLELATAEERDAAGIVEIAEPPAPPAGKVVVPGPLGVVDGVPTRSFTLEDAAEPQPDPVPEVVSDWQFAGQAADQGIISRPAALAWVARGEVPGVLSDAVDARITDPDRHFKVMLFLSGSKEYPRRHPLTPMLAPLLGMAKPDGSADDEKLDAFWRAAGTR